MAKMKAELDTMNARMVRRGPFSTPPQIVLILLL
jgi:hypothetical protein